VKPWYQRTLRWAQTNLTEKDPARYDADLCAGQIACADSPADEMLGVMSGSVEDVPHAWRVRHPCHEGMRHEVVAGAGQARLV